MRDFINDFINGFINGIITGILLKDNVSFVFKNIFINCIKLYHTFKSTNIKNKDNEGRFVPYAFLICKITDFDKFNEYFPKLKTKYRTQPMWEYYKGVIKIELPIFNLSESIKFDDLCSDLDIPFFKSFSELFIYVHYNNFINVYTNESVIDKLDFELNETELSKKYSSLICATINTKNNSIYITKYFKKFLNNKIPLTVEMLILNYDKIDTTCAFNVNLQIVNGKNIYTIYLNETI